MILSQIYFLHTFGSGIGAIITRAKGKRTGWRWLGYVLASASTVMISCLSTAVMTNEACVEDRMD